MLEIRTKRSAKKGLRVDIFRRYRLTDEKSEKVKYTYKQIGSFNLHEGYDVALIECLDHEEILQLKNWLAESKFAEKLGVEADDVDKFNLRIPHKLNHALMKLYTEAKRANIEFTPSEVMLEALLKRAALIENAVDKINGFKSDILKNAGIDAGLEKPKTFDQGDRALFNALLELNQPIGKTCSELEEAAIKLGKNKKIPPPQIKEWAGLIPGRNLERSIKDWPYIIAIEVLIQNGVNPCSLLAPEIIARYWSIPQAQTLDFDDAVKQFCTLFKTEKAQVPAVKQAIELVYKNPTGKMQK